MFPEPVSRNALRHFVFVHSTDQCRPQSSSMLAIIFHILLISIKLDGGLSYGRNWCSKVQVFIDSTYVPPKSCAKVLSSLLVGFSLQYQSPVSVKGVEVSPSSSLVLSSVAPSNNEKGDLERLKTGLSQINYLLSHWREKTTYCNFGEFQRELLLPENKQKLMKAAAETGLLDYDKSATMNIMCRQDPEMVRAYVGLKDENPVLRGAEALMQKTSTLSRIDVDKDSAYIDAVELYVQAVANVAALSYEARTDFLAQETSDRDSLVNARAGRKDYLEEARVAVVDVRDALEDIVSMLHLSE